MVPRGSNSDLNGRFRRNYLLGNAFELWIAIAAVIGALTYFIDRDALQASSIGQEAGALAVAWNISYLIGAAGILAGLVKPDLRIESAGLSLFAAAVPVHALTILLSRGASGLPVTLIYIGLAVAAAMRAYLIHAVVRPGTDTYDYLARRAGDE